MVLHLLLHSFKHLQCPIVRKAVPQCKQWPVSQAPESTAVMQPAAALPLPFRLSCPGTACILPALGTLLPLMADCATFVDGLAPTSLSSPPQPTHYHLSRHVDILLVLFTLFLAFNIQ